MGLQIESVKGGAQATATTATTSEAPAPAAPRAKLAAAGDSIGSSAPRIGAERAKPQALQAPSGGVALRGSTRVASDAGDILWGAAMGALWADALR